MNKYNEDYQRHGYWEEYSMQIIKSGHFVNGSKKGLWKNFKRHPIKKLISYCYFDTTSPSLIWSVSFQLHSITFSTINSLKNRIIDIHREEYE